MGKKACLRSMILERKKRVASSATATHFPTKYSTNRLVTQIHDQRASLTTNVRGTSTDLTEYSALEDRNCVNHPLFSFYIQITLTKLRYQNRFVVYVHAL